ncbi:hypothetical protein MLD38_029313 [Melastoma candidum]|uniref:Uncharacterized protein n=1 Tax=Melastoma candidum TaxID=119954 RepID=A0ACB9N3D9_9MYRT|nr:hypothetical protein MLD38_029313 [Melastoma candidum]
MNDDEEAIRAHSYLWNQMFNFMSSMSLKCAIQLGIPDAIHDRGRPITLSELASALSIHDARLGFLGRLMRVLVHTGLIAVEDDPSFPQESRYALTPASRHLLSCSALNLSPLVLFVLNPAFMESFHCLSEWLRCPPGTGAATPFATNHGMSLWEYMRQDPGLRNAMKEGLGADAPWVGRMMLEKCEGVFDGVKTLVDVGGGAGELSRIVADEFPLMDCIVMDLPHVVSESSTRSKNGNLRFVAGDMFEAVPSADAVLLKWILHDWSDEECVKILKRCREAVSSNGRVGKVILIEEVMRPEDETEHDQTSLGRTIFTDFLMMVSVTGKERNEKEWARLFADTGFVDYRITPLIGSRSLIQVYI